MFIMKSRIFHESLDSVVVDVDDDGIYDNEVDEVDGFVSQGDTSLKSLS